ncbi:shikimate kinase [Lysobacter sp. S4-A87]|uniref:shikimate kinase n=1 Tax=Lysobacter sp. S4-A87 TaxID=2925843 RepID=UPI001F53DBE0|nr:shikimate kinase [Lysobacter sp. S4-A87]UNK50750.1 shikimate kinase [Lysobacter sp. S4-A87]
MNSTGNLILVGPMGAGKSCIGRVLAERFGLRLVDVDHEIEQRAGANISTIFECEGEAGFRTRERSMLAELLADDGMVLSTGGGAVLDPDNRRQLRERGFVVHLHVSVERQIERLARDRSRPLLARGDRAQVLHSLAAEREPLYAQVADLRFDTNHYTATEVASRLAQELQTHWHREAPARIDAGLQRAHSKEPT